jgi:transcriptional/translational regulatory protein YebC/TACO1
VAIECLTENKNRTATNIRVLFRKGQLATSGAASWDFNRLGVIEATPPEGEVDAKAAAIEAGALDEDDDVQNIFVGLKG